MFVFVFSYIYIYSVLEQGRLLQTIWAIGYCVVIIAQIWSFPGRTATQVIHQLQQLVPVDAFICLAFILFLSELIHFSLLHVLY